MSTAGVHDAPGPAESGQSVKDALQQTLEEARMVLPGVQALFGFQLIAVFSDGFERRLDETEQSLHLAAIVLVTVAIAIVMTPAAYHRQVEPRRATVSFLVLASRLVSGAMLPLAAGLSIDVYLIARVITGAASLAAAIGGVVFVLFLALWFAFPQWRAAQVRRQGRR
jgi:MFS family permease